MSSLKGITEEDLDCIVCQEPAKNAVNCVKCQNILCESHFPPIEKCPYCQTKPFNHKKMGSSDDSSPNWKCHVRSAERLFRVEIFKLTLNSSVQNVKLQNRMETKICTQALPLHRLQKVWWLVFSRRRMLSESQLENSRQYIAKGNQIEKQVTGKAKVWSSWNVFYKRNCSPKQWLSTSQMGQHGAVDAWSRR